MLLKKEGEWQASEAGGTAYNIFKGFNQEVAGKTGSAEAGKDKTEMTLLMLVRVFCTI